MIIIIQAQAMILNKQNNIYNTRKLLSMIVIVFSV